MKDELKYQQRVRDEYESLLIKLDVLNYFIRGAFFLGLTNSEQSLFFEQQECMNGYANTLRKRICLLTQI